MNGSTSAVAGAVLGAGVGAVARVRRGKPLHPQGLVLAGRLVRHGAGARSGAEWVDTAGSSDVVARLSRGGGLPRRLPDVSGLAWRDGDQDVLLSSPLGTAPVLRLAPGPRRGHGRTAYSSLLPYQGSSGPVMVLAEPSPPRRLPLDRAELAAALADEPLVLRLAWATPTSAWHPFGVLELRATADARDEPVRFDPLRPPPGLRTYPWVERLRAPAYAAARRRPARPDRPGSRRPAAPPRTTALDRRAP